MATKKAEPAAKAAKTKAAPKKPEVKTAVKAKKAAPEAAAKKAAPPAKTKRAKKAALPKGTRLECPECGIGVVVERACLCDEPCDLTCCGMPMMIC